MVVYHILNSFLVFTTGSEGCWVKRRSGQKTLGCTVAATKVAGWSCAGFVKHMPPLRGSLARYCIDLGLTPKALPCRRSATKLYLQVGNLHGARFETFSHMPFGPAPTRKSHTPSTANRECRLASLACGANKTKPFPASLPNKSLFALQKNPTEPA